VLDLLLGSYPLFTELFGLYFTTVILAPTYFACVVTHYWYWIALR